MRGPRIRPQIRSSFVSSGDFPINLRRRCTIPLNIFDPAGRTLSVCSYWFLHPPLTPTGPAHSLQLLLLIIIVEGSVQGWETGAVAAD